MSFDIKELRKNDYKKIVEFASTGMHFDWYASNKLFLYLYLKYFWYRELIGATDIIAAYQGNRVAGAMLINFKGKKKKYKTLFKSFYVKVFDLFGVEDNYDDANKEMLESCKREYPLDGEISFLVVNPDFQSRGVGSLLLSELERRNKGKSIYLYTDNGCNYKFYEHRGFIKSGEKEIQTIINGKKAPLMCYLYTKNL